MKYPVYCIKDRKGDFYQPKVEQNEASAKRNFAMLVNNPDPMNVIHFNPYDFELYYIGNFDSSMGYINCVDVIEFVCSGDDLIGIMNDKK